MIPLPALLAATCLAAAVNGQDARHDVVIEGGRVVDPETGLDAVRSVGIRDGRIAAVSEAPLEGEVVIDAAGLVVAPGFIDTRAFDDDLVTIEAALLDGVTTRIDCSVGAGDVEAWYAAREGVSTLNYGTTVAHAVVRGTVFAETPKWFAHRMTLEEFNAVLAGLDEGLRAGAVGVGSTITPAINGVIGREMFEAQRLASAYGRMTALRFEPVPPETMLTVVSPQDVLANSFSLGSVLLIQHPGDAGWPLVHELIIRARGRGLPVWGFVEAPYAGVNMELLRAGRASEVPLIQLVSHLGYTAAKHFGDTGLVPMQDRGRLQTGRVADVTIFDFDAGAVEVVLVDGMVVVSDGAVVAGARPGRAIRFAVESETRFTSLTDATILGTPGGRDAAGSRTEQTSDADRGASQRTMFGRFKIVPCDCGEFHGAGFGH